MVLTQPKIKRILMSHIVNGFHTTMVLTQLTATWKGENIMLNVSIPLWFLRNPIQEVKK